MSNDVATRKTEKINSFLAHYNGTENYHRLVNYSNADGVALVGTDGWMAFSEYAECYWLSDLIGSYRGLFLLDGPFMSDHLQVWRIVKTKGDSARIEAWTDTPGAVYSRRLFRLNIGFTDFPFHLTEDGKQYVWYGGPTMLGDNYAYVLYLKSEY